MATETSKQKSSSVPAAEDATRQLSLVKGSPEEAVPTTGPETLKEAAPDEPSGEVPQETVPMPVPAWPPPVAQPEAPAKPPPLRHRGKDARTASITRPTETIQRPGLFTGELRRALPPWALPLLTFQPFSVWLGARIGLTLLAVLAGLMIPSIAPQGTANWYGSAGGPLLTEWAERLGGVWTRWDGQWYLKIATEGYRTDDGSAAFFPLYPWLVRITGWLAADRYIWAGILLSALFFLAALVLLHRLVRLDFHPEDAGRSVFYIAAFPMAFFFWAIYSESLFLFLAVGALLAARTHHWWLAAIAVSFAVWTRSLGLLLVLPVAWEMWLAYHPPLPADPRAMPPARPSPWNITSLLLPFVSLAAFVWWAALIFGDALAPIKAQTDWNRHFSWPWQTIAGAFTQALQTPFEYQPENQSWTYLAALMFALVVGVLALRWLRGSYSIYLWTGILFPLFSATPRNPLLSYPRFLIVLFPAFIVLALIGRNRYANQLITWLSILLLALYTIRFVNWYWVA